MSLIGDRQARRAARPRAARPDRLDGGPRRRPRRLRHRPGRGGQRARSREPGIGWGEIAAVELNEAFASQSLACLAGWPELDPDAGERARRRDRDRPSARRVGHADPRPPRPRAACARRGLRFGGDLHRRRPGPRHDPGGMSVERCERSAPRRIYDPVADTPSCYVREGAGIHPPLDFPEYKSTQLRHPKQPLIYLPQNITELTGPALGSLAPVREGDNDLTRQHDGEPIGERMNVFGRVFDTEGKPLRNTLVEIWQANACGRYRHRWDRFPAPLDPNFSGAGRTLTDERRPLQLRDRQARAVSVGEPLQRLASRAHPLLAARARVRAAAGDADVLPGRPALPLRPDLQLDSATGARESGWSRASRSRTPSRTGRWRTSSTSTCAVPARRRSRRRCDPPGHAFSDRWALLRDRAAVAGGTTRRRSWDRRRDHDPRQRLRRRRRADPRLPARDVAGGSGRALRRPVGSRRPLGARGLSRLRPGRPRGW